MGNRRQNAPEPDSVKALVAKLVASANGDQTDGERVLRIYADFRWGLKKASMIGQVTYRDVEALLEAAIKRVRKQVKDPAVRDQAVEKFTQAKNKLADWVEDEGLRADVCPKCRLPKFLCTCPSE